MELRVTFPGLSSEFRNANYITYSRHLAVEPRASFDHRLQSIPDPKSVSHRTRIPRDVGRHNADARIGQSNSPLPTGKA